MTFSKKHYYTNDTLIYISFPKANYEEAISNLNFDIVNNINNAKNHSLFNVQCGKNKGTRIPLDLL